MSKQFGDSRRRFLKSTLAGGVAAAAVPALSAARAFAPPTAPALNVPAFEYDEATVADLQAAMSSGKETARSLAEKYLARIDAVDKNGPAVNSVIEVNPDAVSIADDLDKERRAQKPRGPLHGIPVLIKDNIETSDRMQTTAGSLALVGSKPVRDSFVAQRLRKSGAVILGKTNLSEWANMRSSHSISGWSGRGGLTKNPYALDHNP
jgi:amidase